MASKPDFKPYEGDEKYIFVSYSHKDDEKVYSLIQQLHDRGFHVWYDEGILAGAEWNGYISQYIKNAAFVLLFISPSAAASIPVNDEITFAKKYRKRIVPVFLYNTEISDWLELRLGRGQREFYYKFENDAMFLDKLSGSPLFKHLRTHSKPIIKHKAKKPVSKIPLKKPAEIKPVIIRRGGATEDLEKKRQVFRRKFKILNILSFVIMCTVGFNSPIAAYMTGSIFPGIAVLSFVNIFCVYAWTGHGEFGYYIGPVVLAVLDLLYPSFMQIGIDQQGYYLTGVACVISAAVIGYFIGWAEGRKLR